MNKKANQNPLEDLGPKLYKAIDGENHDEVLMPTLKALNHNSPNKKYSREFKKYCRDLKKIYEEKIPKHKAVNLQKPMPMSRFLSIPMPKEKWLINELIPDGCVSIISGESRSFKTWILLHMIKRVADGGLVFGKFQANKNSIMLVEEDDKPRTIKDRVTILDYKKSNRVHLWINSGFKIEDDIEDLVMYIKKHKIKVVIFDSLIRIHRGDENVSKDIAQLFSEMIRLTNMGLTVIITHHHRKAQFGQKDRSPLRGSTDILSAVDCHLIVERQSKNNVKIIQNKVRISEEIPPFGVNIISDNKSNIEFEFTNFYAQEDGYKKSKFEQAEELIAELLSENESMDRQAIVDELKNNDIGTSTTDEVLKYLVNNKRLWQVPQTSDTLVQLDRPFSG